MAALDGWIDTNVIDPLYNTDPNQDDWGDAVEQVKTAIRSKVLESYRNGQKAKPRQLAPRRAQ